MKVKCYTNGPVDDDTTDRLPVLVAVGRYTLSVAKSQLRAGHTHVTYLAKITFSTHYQPASHQQPIDASN